jgi:hypothetical protein
MSQEPEVKAAIISSKSGIWIAIIGLVGGLLIAILSPYATKWANRPEPTPNPLSLSIEQLPVVVFVYDGRDENLGGWSSLSISYLNSMPNYHFSYSIPTYQTGYAGMAFRFSGGQNLSNYKRIEFTFQFDDMETEHVIDFYLTDISGQKSHVRMTEIGSSEKKESELLSNFAGINLNAIKEITFNTDNTFVAGDHQVTVSDIRFVP